MMKDRTPSEASVNYLHPGILPVGRITLLVGDPQSGKTALCVWQALQVLADGPLPHRVAVLGDAIGPRILAAGGDPAQMVQLPAATTVGDLPRRLEGVRRCSLLIVDPLAAILAGGSDAELQRELAALADFAHVHDLDVLGTTHFTIRKACARALARIKGGSTVSSAAGAILAVGRLETDRPVLVPLKSADGRPGRARRFELRENGDIQWGDFLAVAPDDTLAGRRGFAWRMAAAADDREGVRVKVLALAERRGGRITPADVTRYCRSVRSVLGAVDVLNGLVADGLGEWATVEPGPTGGRPGRVFVVKHH